MLDLLVASENALLQVRTWNIGKKLKNVYHFFKETKLLILLNYCQLDEVIYHHLLMYLYIFQELVCTNTMSQKLNWLKP